MKSRICLTLSIIILVLLISVREVHASEDSCNQWERIQSIILSEATRQPFEAQLEIARVIVTKGACYLDEGFYSGYGVANRISERDPRGCIANLHCRAYFLLTTFDPAIRESPALAAHVALTEYPRVRRFHFDNWQSTAYWWNSLKACPSGWFIVAEIKVC